MTLSNRRDQWTQTSKASAPKQQIQSNESSLGQLSVPSTSISPNGNLTIGSSTNLSTSLSATTDGAGAYTYGNPWGSTTAGGTGTYIYENSWDSTRSSIAPLIDTMRDLLVSLGFVENLVEHTYELDLKTKVRIPIGTIADLPQPQAQKVIDQYLDEMKKKILEQVTNKILINRLIDTEKKNKNIKDN